LLYALGHLNINSVLIRGVALNFFAATLLLLFTIYKISASGLLLPLSLRMNPNTGIFLILMGVIIAFSSSNNLKNAYLDIFTGNAKKESAQNLWVRRYIENSTQESLLIPQFNKNSKTLFFFDIPHSRKDWEYWVDSIYFKKDILTDYTQSIDDFIEMNSPKYFYTLNDSNKYSYIYKFNSERINQSKEKKIIVNALLKGDIPDEAKLFFSNEYNKDHIQLKNIAKNSLLYYEYKIDSLDIHNTLDIYIYNDSENELKINYLKVELK